MAVPIERLIVSRFDLASSLDLFQGHIPLLALGGGMNVAGALSDKQFYREVSQHAPFRVAGPSTLRVIPTGWPRHTGIFWRRLSGHAVDLKRSVDAPQALAIQVKSSDQPSIDHHSPAPVLCAWLWPFAISNQLSATQQAKSDLVDAGDAAEGLLRNVKWQCGAAAPVQGSALFKAHRNHILGSLWPQGQQPKTRIRVDQFTITTALALPGANHLALRRWTKSATDAVYGALLGLPADQIPADVAASLRGKTTLADLRQDSFLLLYFGANESRALIYLTQSGVRARTRWAWCLTMNVAHLIMTSLALARLCEDLRDDALRADQRAAARDALKALGSVYNGAVAQPLQANHAWIQQALSDKKNGDAAG